MPLHVWVKPLILCLWAKLNERMVTPKSISHCVTFLYRSLAGHQFIRAFFGGWIFRNPKKKQKWWRKWVKNENIIIRIIKGNVQQPAHYSIRIYQLHLSGRKWMCSFGWQRRHNNMMGTGNVNRIFRSILLMRQLNWLNEMNPPFSFFPFILLFIGQIDATIITAAVEAITTNFCWFQQIKIKDHAYPATEVKMDLYVTNVQLCQYNSWVVFFLRPTKLKSIASSTENPGRKSMSVTFSRQWCIV